MPFVMKDFVERVLLQFEIFSKKKDECPPVHLCSIEQSEKLRFA